MAPAAAALKTLSPEPIIHNSKMTIPVIERPGSPPKIVGTETSTQNSAPKGAGGAAGGHLEKWSDRYATHIFFRSNALTTAPAFPTALTRLHYRQEALHSGSCYRSRTQREPIRVGSPYLP
jgi:hypothetical protein